MGFLLNAVKSQSCNAKCCYLGLSTGASLNEEEWGGTQSRPTSQRKRGDMPLKVTVNCSSSDCRLIGSTGSSWLRGNRKVTEGITRWLLWIMTPSIQHFLSVMPTKKCWIEVCLSCAVCLWNDVWFACRCCRVYVRSETSCCCSLIWSIWITFSQMARG